LGSLNKIKKMFVSWKKGTIQIPNITIHINEESKLDNSQCDKKSCIYWKDRHCSLTDPEKVGDTCLDFEDAMDFLRLKADAIKGTLG
jgi:hypothetical protein